jgi:hypothetical protein
MLRRLCPLAGYSPRFPDAGLLYPGAWPNTNPVPTKRLDSRSAPRGPRNDTGRVSRGGGRMCDLSATGSSTITGGVNGSVNESRRVGSERVRRSDAAALVFADPGQCWGDVAVRGRLCPRRS